MNRIPLIKPLQPQIMDEALARGLYRMQQSIFTTNAIFLDDGFWRVVVWARVTLKGFKPTSTHKELNRRNKRFTCTLADAIIDQEIEDLYTSYAQNIDFDAPESATSFLMGASTVNFFPARMWQVRDNGQLIAAGYFDEGIASAAGILNFYHPGYRKYSLGKWLYFESMRYAAETGKHYFYPGYISPDYAKFDYKLLAGKDRIELWDSTEMEWVAFNNSAYANAF